MDGCSCHYLASSSSISFINIFCPKVSTNYIVRCAKSQKIQLPVAALVIRRTDYGFLRPLSRNESDNFSATTNLDAGAFRGFQQVYFHTCSSQIHLKFVDKHQIFNFRVELNMKFTRLCHFKIKWGTKNFRRGALCRRYRCGAKIRWWDENKFHSSVVPPWLSKLSHIYECLTFTCLLMFLMI